ncbi:MAG: cytochrome P450 [Acidimicrobiia bacterium]
MTTSTDILFDPTDPELRRDPYPTYRRMREEAPAWRSPGGTWYFSRYEDCVDLMRSPALSYDSTATAAYQASLSDDDEVRAHQLAETQKNKSLLDVDPPEHTRLRSLINRAFTPGAVEETRPMIDEYVDMLIDTFDGDTIDLVEHYGSMLPILVICRMMGISTDDRHEFLAVGNAVARSVDPDVPLEQKLVANARMREYIGGLVDARRSTPGDDLMTRLIEATEDGRIVSLDELLINTGILLIAGFETTTNLITNGVYRLLERPDQLAAYTADAAMDRTAIDEILRFDPPTQFMRARTIIEDTEIGGAELHPGDPVVPLLAAANRDPEEFEDAERLDVARGVNRHLSFGVGHHLCIGAGLARMEARVAIRRLFERYPDLALAPDQEPEYRPNLQLRGFSKLPVTLG